jgi:serine phosphatase RsbU (regulator of sigma subunit)
VEDDGGDALIVEEHLRDSGLSAVMHRVRTLAELAALDDVGDCVLLDLGLPDAEGLEALHDTLRLVGSTPVIVLTGLFDRDVGVAAVKAGAEDYLIKDEVSGQTLFRSIRYAIARREADVAERRLFESELRAAENDRLGRGLLPRLLIDDERLAWATRYQPGGGDLVLGGDLFDAVEMPDGTVRALIADVAGHGPDEAALGVSLRIAWRTLVLGAREDSAVLPTLQQLLTVERPHEQFVTACELSIAPDRRSVSTRVAGHPAPLLFTAGGVCELPTPNRSLPLGILDDHDDWPVHVCELPSTWWLLLYTDGLIEGRSGPTDRLGLDGLLRLIHEQERSDGGVDLDGLIHAVEVVNGGALDDDIAMLALRWPADR